MADRPLFTNAAAIAGANALGKTIADPDADPDPIVAKVRLFGPDFVPDNGTTRADLEDAEIGFTGYPVGGYSLTGFDSAKFAPGGGAVITSNLINVAYTTGTGAICSGYWVEDATDPDPLVREVYVYDPPRPLNTVGNGWPIAVQLGFGANAS